MRLFYIFFFFNNTATTEIYTLSLHDALPISEKSGNFSGQRRFFGPEPGPLARPARRRRRALRSEEHTSELQSRPHLVCRLLLEKKKKKAMSRSYTQMKKTSILPHSSSAIQSE